MKYVQHDFAGNIAKLQQSGEVDKVQKLILDEVGQLMVYHRGHLVAALNEAGFPTDPKASDKKISEVMADALKKSDSFRTAISTLLVGLNRGDAFHQATGCPQGQFESYFGKSQKSQQHHNAGGYTPQQIQQYMSQQGQQAPRAGLLSGASGGAVGAIAGALGSIIGGAQQNQNNKTQAEIERLKLAQQILEAKNRQQPSATGNTWLWVVLGSAAAITLGVVIYKKTRPTTV